MMVGNNKIFNGCIYFKNYWNPFFKCFYYSRLNARQFKPFKSGRLRLVGKLGEKRTPSRILIYQIYGKRPAGLPRLRWMDNIEHNVQVLGFKAVWTERALDRIRWRRTVVAALGFRLGFLTIKKLRRFLETRTLCSNKVSSCIKEKNTKTKKEKKKSWAIDKERWFQSKLVVRNDIIKKMCIMIKYFWCSRNYYYYLFLTETRYSSVPVAYYRATLREPGIFIFSQKNVFQVPFVRKFN